MNEETLLQILDGIEYGEIDSKLSYLNKLDDLIEFKQLNLQDTSDAIEKLITIVLYETNMEIFRDIFRAIENLFLYNSSVNVSLQPLIDEMEYDESILANTLLLLPFTSKKEYIVLAELYQKHQNELVRKNAVHALKYLKGGNR